MHDRKPSDPISRRLFGVCNQTRRCKVSRNCAHLYQHEERHWCWGADGRLCGPSPACEPAVQQRAPPTLARHGHSEKNHGTVIYLAAIAAGAFLPSWTPFGSAMRSVNGGGGKRVGSNRISTLIALAAKRETNRPGSDTRLPNPSDSQPNLRQ